MEKLNYYALTITGRRKVNQDSCTVLDLGNEVYFLTVADGMGGVAGGQVASSITLSFAKNLLEEKFKNEVKPEDLKDILTELFASAQKSMAKAIEEKPDLAGMGTTLVGVLIHGDKFAWGNLGDSRAYHFREGELNQLSVDHTYIEDYKKESEGEIPQSIIDQYSHYLTRAMDGGSDQADIYPADKSYETLQDGDAFLLCSDGLITNKVETNVDTIKNYYLSSLSLKQAAQDLINFAYHDGSNDNISVVLAEVGSVPKVKMKLKKYLFPPTDGMKQKLFDLKWWIASSFLFLVIVLFFIFL